MDAHPGEAIEAVLTGIDDLAGLALLPLLLVLAIIVALTLPFLLLAVELALVAVAAVLFVLLRVLLRRPWIVEAWRGSGDVAERVGAWAVVGWRRAGRAVDEVARRLEVGEPLPPEGRWDPDVR